MTAARATRVPMINLLDLDPAQLAALSLNAARSRFARGRCRAGSTSVLRPTSQSMTDLAKPLRGTLEADGGSSRARR